MCVLFPPSPSFPWNSSNYDNKCLILYLSEASGQPQGRRRDQARWLCSPPFFSCQIFPFTFIFSGLHRLRRQSPWNTRQRHKRVDPSYSPPQSPRTLPPPVITFFLAISLCAFGPLVPLPFYSFSFYYYIIIVIPILPFLLFPVFSPFSENTTMPNCAFSFLFLILILLSGSHGAFWNQDRPPRWK